MRSTGGVWVAALLLSDVFVSQAGAAEKPSAVQVCLQGLAPDEPLFVDTPRRHYRSVGSSLFMLDLDVALNGQQPERITHSGGNCLRAWIQPLALKTVSFKFDRTATNLEPVNKSLNMQLKADKWHDAGTVSLERAAFSRVSTRLPGTLTVQRREPESLDKVSSLDHLAEGTYVLTYVPPEPPKGPCPIELVVDASGTITKDTNPAAYQALVDTYQKQVAPALLLSHNELCASNEVVQVQLQLNDGVYRNGWNPGVTKTAKTLPPPTYTLEVDGQKRPYHSGDPIRIGTGQTLVLE
jgi:hypothetical protein